MNITIETDRNNFILTSSFIRCTVLSFEEYVIFSCTFCLRLSSLSLCFFFLSSSRIMKIASSDGIWKGFPSSSGSATLKFPQLHHEKKNESMKNSHLWTASMRFLELLCRRPPNPLAREAIPGEIASRLEAISSPTDRKVDPNFDITVFLGGSKKKNLLLNTKQKKMNSIKSRIKKRFQSNIHKWTLFTKLPQI